MSMFSEITGILFGFNLLSAGSDIIIIALITILVALFARNGKTFALTYMIMFSAFTLLGWIRVVWLSVLVALLCGIYIITTLWEEDRRG